MGRRTHSREETHLSTFLQSKLVSTENLEKSLSVGSKKRLRQYQRNLSVSQGTEKALFDDKLRDCILEYALDSRDVFDQIDYLNNLVDQDGYHFSRDLKLYDRIEESLLEFSSPDHPSFRWNKNYQARLKELTGIFSKYRLNPITFGSDDEIRESLPKEDTHSGFYWIVSGKKRKGDNLAGLYDAFQYEKEKALRNGSFNSPILLGFRTQASGEYDDEGQRTNSCKHKTRMVSMYDLISIVNELQFSVPFQGAIGAEPLYAGGKDMYELSSIVNSMRTKYTKYFSIDFSHYDSTVSSWLIEDAFKVVRSAFGKLSVEQERLFDIMVHDFIHKTFILNEGCLRVHRGVPSGSMWTQIIDSIVNVLVSGTYFIAIHKEAEFIAMGDDNLITTNYETSISNLASYIMKNFGLIVKVEAKSKMGSTKSREGVKFLSRYWRWDGQYRDPHQLLSRMLFPERFRNYNDEVTPDLVLYAFILTYGLGMAKLIDVPRFMREHPNLRKELLYSKVDSRYLPGSLAFIREYTRRRRVAFA